MQITSDDNKQMSFIRILTSTLFITITVLAFGCTWADIVSQLCVKPSSEVTGSTVTLGDIATVQTETKEMADRIKGVTVCSSPLPGKSRIVAKDQIITALKRRGIYDSVELLCPPLISVSRSCTTIQGDTIFETVRQFILNAQAWPGTVSVEPIRLPGAEIVPVGQLELRVKPGPKTISRGRNYVPLEILVDGHVYRVVSVPVLVRMIAKVPVSSRAIARNEILNPSNIVWEEREITLLPEDIVIGDLASTWMASVPIPQGAVLRRQWLSQPPVIRSGNEVEVVVTSGAVRVTDKGIAIQDGQIGDKIKVRLQRGPREIRATVKGPGITEITIAGGK